MACRGLATQSSDNAGNGSDVQLPWTELLWQYLNINCKHRSWAEISTLLWQLNIAVTWDCREQTSDNVGNGWEMELSSTDDRPQLHMADHSWNLSHSVTGSYTMKNSMSIRTTQRTGCELPCNHHCDCHIDNQVETSNATSMTTQYKQRAMLIWDQRIPTAKTHWPMIQNDLWKLHTGSELFTRLKSMQHSDDHQPSKERGKGATQAEGAKHPHPAVNTRAEMQIRSWCLYEPCGIEQWHCDMWQWCVWEQPKCGWKADFGHNKHYRTTLSINKTNQLGYAFSITA